MPLQIMFCSWNYLLLRKLGIGVSDEHYTCRFYATICLQTLHFCHVLVEVVAVAVVVVSATNTLGTEANFAKEWL